MEKNLASAFDYFVEYCFKHGGHLKNHRDFGEMSRELRRCIVTLEKLADEARNIAFDTEYRTDLDDLTSDMSRDA
jgi:hypothetical protein